MMQFKDKKDIQRKLDTELILLNSMLDVQKGLNKQILVFTKCLAENLSLDGLRK